ncbi:MAG: NADH-quinone oxidoreductase subunit J [Chthonomonas sp.]|nr:NADH-quinone oxidoreductase subunit J [Chthonomonas sp.]
MELIPLPPGVPFTLNWNQLSFLILAGVAALFAIGVVAMKNPVRSAMCLVVNFLILAIVYFTLNSQLLGITQIMVYAGAIMVLFLFVMMLLNLRAKTTLSEKIDPRMFLAVPMGLALLAGIAYQVFWPLREFVMPKAHDSYGSPQAIGITLFTDYAYPFEVTSVLLLVGVVGSVLLAKRRV